VFSKVNRDVVGKRDYDLATKSFLWKKGTKDSGFRPLEYKDELFREYGYFTNKFKGYDNFHGYRDDNYHILANYWNMAWANKAKEWNFTCDKGEKYNDCLKKVKYQQKIVFTSSPKTPLRMLPANCAIAKDYNYAMLAARYAAMNPGSDTREFDKWYFENYKNDFTKEITASDGSKVTVRDNLWYTTDLNDSSNKYFGKWEDMCFVPEKYAWIQKWDGSFIGEDADDITKDEMETALEQYKNDIVVMVKNPVESFVPARDGKALYGFENYYNLSSESRENAVKICVNEKEAAMYKEDKVMHFETCVTNNKEMTTLYVTDAGNAEWQGDRWDCKVFGEDEPCTDGTVAVKAACVLTEERACEVEGGYPVLRHKYDNGNPYAALINWVEKPTDYGILGVSQWNVNPETGQSIGGGSNIAGSVLAWATTRAVELARMLISEDDPAAWDWKELINPDYAEYPSVVWDNNAKTVSTKSVVKNDSNTMNMVNEPQEKMTQEERLKAANAEYLSRTQKYDRFDYSTIKGSDWESKMVPYSIKKALFPWSDPSDSPTYTDAERDLMSPWYSGATAMEAQMLRYIDAKALDFDFDETFMDGSIIQFIKEKQAALRGEMPDWNENDTNKKKYSDALIYSIYNELEKLMFKGVAEHEMGHTMGLRHNFAGSTDVANYGDEYYATRNFPAMMDGVKNLLEQEQTKADYTPATFGIKAYRYKKAFESDINYFTYTSVMDYQREAYIHSVGLGKYDLAAFKFVYGRSFEKVKTVTGKYGALVVQGGEGDDTKITPKLNPLRDPNLPDFVRTNESYLDTKGELKKVDVPTDIKIYYENGKKITTLVPKANMLITGQLEKDPNSGLFVLDYDCDESSVDCTDNLTYLINDGSHYEYIFASDERSSDDPRVNTFDAGYLASDIVRQMADMDNMYYFLRFFNRGNPKFREFRGRTSMKMIMDTLFNKYKYIHFLLDFNFYAYGKWAPYLLGLYTSDCNSTFEVPTGTEMTEKKVVSNYICEEYQRAIKGEEYWIENGELRTLTPMGPADHVIAGMEGMNYFYFDTLYRPAVGEYMKIDGTQDPDIASKLEDYDKEDGQKYYYQTTDNYIDGISDVYPASSFVEVPMSVGRFQKDRYDIQDNSSIYYDKVMRRGFAEEKMVAIYAITNAGWWDAKYRRESRANAADQMFDGLANIKFAMLADVANEEALFSFTPYCVDTKNEVNGEIVPKVVKVDVPVNLLTNYGAEPPFKNGTASLAYTPKKNICSQVGTPGQYVPLHAGWTYFDKMWPMYFAMGNVANTSADTSVYFRFVSYKIPVNEISLYPEPDVNEVQFLNQDGNHYYRAVLATSTLDNLDSRGLKKWQDCKKLRVEAGLEFESCIEDVVADDNTQRFTTSEQFRVFLAAKYAKYNPAFRLVQSAGELKTSEVTAMESGDEGFSRLVIMETTLDQLNLFAYDNLGFAAYYASHY
ncbi:MAG TPA: zinc-dependent metalloprotease, partial [bacterium]|nr:zinc-dependent metalloprotease [bacterium]